MFSLESISITQNQSESISISEHYCGIQFCFFASFTGNQEELIDDICSNVIEQSEVYQEIHSLGSRECIGYYDL